MFKILRITIIIVFSFLIGYFINQKNIDELNAEIKKQENVPEEDLGYELREKGFYRFINPLLECEMAKGTIDSKKQNFDKELGVFVQKEIDESNLTKMGIYFRDLNNGPTFGINEDELFIPASLLKLPIMMVYFYIAEKDPGILKKEIIFEKPTELKEMGVQFIEPSQEIKIGNKYTAEQLIEAMIKYSDNQAVILLTNNLSDSGYTQKTADFFNFFNIDSSNFTNLKGSLSVKEYGRFFRILFNASSLNRDYSEKALKLLSEVEYKNALVAGLPKGIVVSHKFGESGFSKGERQLHDCGIVYYPNHPYLLCIMSKGENLSVLESSISKVSQFVYNKIAEQY